MTESSTNDMGFEDDDAGVPEVAGSEAAFKQFIAEARALPPDALHGYRGAASLIHYNVTRGAEAVLAERATVQKLPGLDIARIERLPTLALALVYAAELTERAPAGQAAAEVKPLLQHARPLRRMMLSALEACAEAGLIPLGEVQPIRAGTGPNDAVGDIFALVALYRKYNDALKHKTPVTPEHLREASEVATELQQRLTPKGAVPNEGGRTPAEMEDDRNHLWSLLCRDHALLQRAAGFLWGSDAAEHAPPLLSRASTTRAKAAAPAPADA